MFNSLKNKLKSWISRTKDEVVEEPVEDTSKEESKKSSKEKPTKKSFKKKDAKKAVPKEKPREKKETSKPKKEKSPTPKLSEETTTKKESTSEEPVTEELPQEKPLIEEPITEKPIQDTVEQDDYQENEPVVKKSFFSKFRRSLSQEKFDESFEELELILLQNNVAFQAIDSIRSSLEDKLVGESSSVDIASGLKEAIEELLIDPPIFLDEVKSSLQVKKPFVILFCGINGSGKTTTIAKLANFLLKNEFSVCLAAADTFRAASIEQIGEHAKRLGVPLIKKDYGSDPASVGFDAVAYAKKHGVDVVLIDTAGRMQNKDSLMREIEKISRVSKPDMKIFLGESITGNDATNQAKSFNDAIGLTGIILSKADVDEKGGTALSVSHVTNKPILFLGTGQFYDDLEVFDKHKLIEKLF